MRWSDCVLPQVEDKEVEKTQAAFYWKPQPYGSMGSAPYCIQEVVGSIPAGEQAFSFFRKSKLFAYTFFLKFSFDTSVTWHSKHALKQNLSEIKCTLSGNSNMLIVLTDSCFCLFFTARWRHWCREKIVNSCCTFLSKPRWQTVVYHLSYGFNPSLYSVGQFFFSFWIF